MLTIRNKSEVAEIYISGEIVDDEEGGWLRAFREGETTGYEFPAKLKAQLDLVKDKELEIHINSYGGSIFAGVAMANFIASHKPKTTCIIDGIAASIASQIFFSGDSCKMPANAYLMMHSPFTYIEGNAEELRKAADILDTLQKGLETTYNKKARESITTEKIGEMIKAETWLTGTEAAQHFKIELLEPVKNLNSIGNKDRLKRLGITKCPESLNLLEERKMVEEKIKLALSRTRGFA